MCVCVCMGTCAFQSTFVGFWPWPRGDSASGSFWEGTVDAASATSQWIHAGTKGQWQPHEALASRGGTSLRATASPPGLCPILQAPCGSDVFHSHSGPSCGACAFCSSRTLGKGGGEREAGAGKVRPTQGCVQSGAEARSAQTLWYPECP